MSLSETRFRSAGQPCSFDHFLKVLDNPTSAFAGIPRTLRDNVGCRSFGNFGTILLAEKPGPTDLSDRVRRLRAIDATRREDIPLRAHPDQTADDRRFQFATACTAIVIIGWIVFGVLIAAFAGKL